MLEKKIIQIHLLFAGWILDNSTKDLKFAFTNLTPFTMYDVYVAAETSAGTGPKSNLSVFTPPEGKNVSFRELIIYF
jgi:receptor-type tyrosine-protein phosphatase Q